MGVENLTSGAISTPNRNSMSSVEGGMVLRPNPPGCVRYDNSYDRKPSPKIHRSRTRRSVTPHTSPRTPSNRTPASTPPSNTHSPSNVHSRNIRPRRILSPIIPNKRTRVHRQSEDHQDNSVPLAQELIDDNAAANAANADNAAATTSVTTITLESLQRSLIEVIRTGNETLTTVTRESSSNVTSKLDNVITLLEKVLDKENAPDKQKK